MGINELLTAIRVHCALYTAHCTVLAPLLGDSTRQSQNIYVDASEEEPFWLFW